MMDIDAEETQEWVTALRSVIKTDGMERARFLVGRLNHHMQEGGPLGVLQTPYQNTVAKQDEPNYPGNLEVERNITNLMRWNAMAMVLRANQKSDGIGGHIASYASAAVLYEVGFNHFFQGSNKQVPDQIFLPRSHHPWHLCSCLFRRPSFTTSSRSFQT